MSDFDVRLRAALAQVPEKLRLWWGGDPGAFDKARAMLASNQPLSAVDETLRTRPTTDAADAALFQRRTSATLLDRLHAIGDQLPEFAASYAHAAISQAPAIIAPNSFGQREVFRIVLEGVLQDTRNWTDIRGLVARVREIIDDPAKSSRPETQAVPKSATANNGLLRSLYAQLDLYQTPDQVFDAINDLVRDTYRYEHMMQFAVEGLSKTVGTATTANTADWASLWNVLRGGIAAARASAVAQPLQPGSLIYVYWLDEAGLFWAAERLADRLHNGIVPTTAPLAGVRLQQLSLTGRAMAQFARIWRQGQLAPVGERAAQYAALYGYPLHIAGRAARGGHVDLMQAFPGAFNHALRSALQFYKDSRNLMIRADVTAGRQAFEGLARVLDQGNENLRMIKPLEFRVQAEYVKLLLGGSRTMPIPPIQQQIYAEWRSALTPRPGVADTMDPWQVIVDSVADRYRLRTVSSADYHTLAENGELILVSTRLLQLGPGGIAAVSDGAFKAFLLLLEDAIQKYAGALATVTGLDLRSEGVAAADLSAPPATMLAARYAPPAVSPLRDEWPRPLVVAKA